MAESIGRLGVAAVVAVMLAGCAEARMSDNGSAPVTTGSYGIGSDAGSHGSVYSWLFGSNDTRANQSLADARAAPSGASSATVVPARSAAPSTASSPTVAPAQQTALASTTPATAAATPPSSGGAGAYGIPSDAGSHGSVYSYLFGQNGKPAEVTSGTAVPVTSYGIPADAGSHGSLYSLLFGSKDAPAPPANGSTATPTAPPPSQ